MAGTVTAVEEKITSLAQITLTWVSDASGDVSGTATTGSYTGQIVGYVCVPDGGGTQPTDQFDVTVLDENSLDVLHGNGANQSNAANTYVDSSNGLGNVVGSTLTLTIANAGNAKGGTIYLHVLQR